VVLLYLFDNFVLDTDRRELRAGVGAVEVEPQVFDLLEYLIRHRERVVSRDELIESIWGGRVVSESALSTRINAVRSAVGDSGTQQRLIKTLPRKGVRFVGDVRDEQRTSEVAPPSVPENGAAAPPIELRQVGNGLPVTINGHADALPPHATAPPRRHFMPRIKTSAIAAIGVACFVVLTWSYFARSAQSEQTKANIEMAAKLTKISQTIAMTSRENYEAVRGLEQWAVSLDRQNPAALARLTSAMVTGVLNQWSSDAIADLQTADLALQDATRIAPGNIMVRAVQCHILRAMRQFEAAIKVCSEVAKSFPNYPILHKEIGYNRLMLGQIDEALAEFLEADRIAPNARLRWSWDQGIGLIYLMQGHDEKAIEQLSRAALEAPNAGHPVAYLASAYALVGREQEAREALDHHLKLWPNTTLSNFEPLVGSAAFNSKMERVLEGLRLAGLKQ
jgi:DNA-binding winged helix-turn-helix (wHTH) protein/tetratricopeptide (TPR) repeat protein